MVRSKRDFPKSEKVRTKPEIDRIFRTGARFSCKGMAIRAAPSISGGPSRVVFVAVRTFDGAIQRNRAKRVAREVWRLNKDEILPGRDVAVILYPEMNNYADCSRAMLFLLRKAGLIR
ncbi:MAG: ribonuclease P protein component [Spirochaetes bacterium]|nr:ribonuclease P protein component [Spirochaetota bacterium]